MNPANVKEVLTVTGAGIIHSIFQTILAIFTVIMFCKVTSIIILAPDQVIIYMLDLVFDNNSSHLHPVLEALMMMTSLSLAKQFSSLFYKILLTFWHLRLFLILGAVFVVYNVYSGVWAGLESLQLHTLI